MNSFRSRLGARSALRNLAMAGAGLLVLGLLVASSQFALAQGLLRSAGMSAASASGISGRIVNAEGQPVEAASVEAYLLPSGDWVAKTAADADGNYAFSDLAPGTYEVWAWDPDGGYLDQSVENVSVIDGQITSGVNFVLPTAGHITGRIESPEGDGLAGVQVNVYQAYDFGDGESWWDTVASSKSTTSGTYDVGGLRSGSYRLSFSDGEGRYLRQSFQGLVGVPIGDDRCREVTVTVGTTTTGVDDTLTVLAGHITGRVTESEVPTAGIGDVAVTAYVWDEGWGGWKEAAWGSTRPDGTYDLGGLTSSEYRVSFSDPAGAHATEFYDDARVNNAADARCASVSVTVGATTSGIDAALEAAGRIRGVVTDPSARSIPDVQIVAYPSEQSSDNAEAASTWTDEYGRYSLGGLATGSYRVMMQGNDQFSSTGYPDVQTSDPYDPRCASVDVTAGAVTDDIDLHPLSASRITGVVTGPAGVTGLADVEVEVYTETSMGWVYRATTDANGLYTVAGLIAGDYRVVFQDPSGVHLPEVFRDVTSSDPFDSRGETVTVGPNAVVSGINASLDVAGHITGRVTDTSTGTVGLADISVQAYRWDVERGIRYWASSAITLSDGTYDLGGLPTGAYQIGFADNTGSHVAEFYDDVKTTDVWDERCRSVSVTAGATTPGIDAALDAAGSITGRVTDSGSPLFNVRVAAYPSVQTSDNAELASVWTDENGDYVLSGLPTGSYRLKMDGSFSSLPICYQDVQTSDPYDPRCSALDVTAGVITAGIDFHSQPASNIFGKVTGPDGIVGLMGVSVSAYRWDGASWVWVTAATTSPTGEYSLFGLSEGEYRFTFWDWSGSHLPEFYRDAPTIDPSDPRCETLSVLGGSMYPGVNASLDVAGHISGNVSAAGGGAGGSFVVNAYRSSDTSHAWEWAGASSVSSGTYDLGGLRPGWYALVFWDNGGTYQPQVYNGVPGADVTAPGVSYVPLGSGETVSGIDANMMLPGGQITGRVTNALGVTPDSVVVELWSETYGMWGNVRQAGVAPDGSYNFSGLAPGSYRVRFWDMAGVYAEQAWDSVPTRSVYDSRCADVMVSDGTTAAGIDATMQVAARISGTVTAPDPRLLSSAAVLVHQQVGGGWEQVAMAYPGPDGTYQVPGLWAGTYRVSFIDYMGGDLEPQCYRDVPTSDITDARVEDITLAAGDERTGVDAVFGMQNYISGTLTASDGGAAPILPVAELYRWTGSSFEHWAGRGIDPSATAGTYAFSSLAPGIYRVRFVDYAGEHLTQMYSGIDTEDVNDPRAQNLVVIDGSAITGIDATMHSAGRITGHVVSAETSAPLEGAWVEAFRWEDGQSQPASEGARVAVTGTTGEYTIAGLAPGSYRVRFSDSFGTRGTVCYDAVPTDDIADSRCASIAVGPGSVASGIDAALVLHGAISGRVTDGASGAGLFSARIDLYRDYGGGWGYVGTVTSDPNGGYGFGNLPSDTYRVVFHGQSGSSYGSQCYNGVAGTDVESPLCTDITVADGVTTVGIDATLTRSSIRGRVTAADGSGIENVFVDVRKWTGSTWASVSGGSTNTTASGGYDIPVVAGTYRVRFTDRTNRYYTECYNSVRTPNHLDSRCANITVLEGLATGGIDASMVARGKITGRVTTSDTSETVEGATVTIYTRAGATWTAGASTQTTASGGYAFDRLPTGAYRIGFSGVPGGYVPEFYRDVHTSDVYDSRCATVSAGEDTVTAGIDAVLEPYGKIVGRVIGADTGLGIGSVDVYALRKEGGSYYWEASGRTAANGDYELAGLLGGGYRLVALDSSGEYLTTTHPDLPGWVYDSPAATEVTVTVGGVGTADFSLPKASHIKGRIKADDTGDGLANVAVTAALWDGSDWVPSYADTGSVTPGDGSYDIKGLPAGEYRLQFREMTGNYLTECYNDVPTANIEDSRCETISVGTGVVVSGIDASLAPVGHITGRVSFSVEPSVTPDVNVEAFVHEGTEWTSAGRATVQPDGTYDLSSLRTGDYTLRFESSSPEWLTELYDDVPAQDLNDPRAVSVHVDAPQTTGGIDAVIEPVRHIRGRITGADGMTGITGFATAYQDSGAGWTAVQNAASDDSGYYDISDLGAGDYRVTFESPGYVRGAYDGLLGVGVDDARCATVTIGAEPVVSGIDAALPYGGMVLGSVVGPDQTTQLVGITVEAFRWDGSAWYLAAQTTSGDIGDYAFIGLPSGRYRLRFTDPSGVYITSCYYDADTADITDPACTDITVMQGGSPFLPFMFDAPMAMGATGHITGRVTDGPSGSGLAAANVDAYRWDSTSWTLERSAQTTSSGGYDIGRLNAGDYRLQFTDPSGQRVTEGYNGVATTNVNDSRCESITVAALSTVTGIDADLYPYGHISGRVIGEDASGGAAGIYVYLYKEGQSGVWTYAGNVRTGVSGAYTLDHLQPGTYRIRFFDAMSHYLEQCYDGVYTSDVADSRCVDIDLAPGANAEGVDATLYEYAHLRGTVTAADGGAPLAGVTATAYRQSGSSWAYAASTATTASGGWDIGGLNGGTYRVRFADGTGEYLGECYNNVSTTDINDSRCTDLNLSTSFVRDSIDASLTKTGHIEGAITDAGTGAPLPGAQAKVWRWSGSAWAVVGSTTARADGTYDVRSLPAGDYRVSFSAGAAYLTQSYNNVPGSDVSDGRCTQVTVLAGASATGVNAALVQYGSITGHVFSADTSGPLQGALATAYRWDGVNWVAVSSATSDEFGAYHLTNMVANTYRIAFTNGSGNYMPVSYKGVPSGSVSDPRCTSVAVLDGQVTAGVDETMTVGAHIAGKVVAENGSAIANATVTVYDWDGSSWGVLSSTSTTASGGYAVAGLRAGSYRVRFSDPSGLHVTECFDDVPTSVVSDSRCENVPVAEAAWTRGIDATLTPYGIITGAVTDAVSGAPIPDTGVTAFSWSGASWVAKGSATTTASGGYAIAGLPTGTYKLRYLDNSGAHLSGCYRDVPTSDLLDARVATVAVAVGTVTTGVAETLVPVAPDQYESDNSTAQAAALSVGGSQQHLILPGDTVDWIKFDVQSAFRYRLITGGALASGVSLDLFSASGLPLMHGASYMDYFSLADETVYLRISAPGTNRFGPYTIALDAVQSRPPAIVQIAPGTGTRIHGRRALGATTYSVAEMDSLSFECSIDSSQTWQPIGGAAKASGSYDYLAWNLANWDTTLLPDGHVLVRASARNAMGQDSTSSPVVDLLIDNTAPSAPTSLEASASGTAIDLTWRSVPETDVAGYTVFRREGESGGFTRVATSAGLAWKDTQVTDGRTYTYHVTATDGVGNVSPTSSDATASPLVDTVAPTASAGPDQSACTYAVLLFDSTGSKDDRGIVSYEWAYGDGATGTGSSAYHAYSTPGSYTVELTVRDAHGNTTTDAADVSIQRADDTFGTLFVDTRDAGTSGALSNVEVLVRLASGTTMSGKTDANGQTRFSVPAGPAEVMVYRDGYLPEKQALTVGGGANASANFTLEHTDVLMGEVKVKRMTLAEIEAAHIDITNPANFNISTFTIQWGNQTLTGYTDNGGGDWNWGGGGGGGGGGSSGPVGRVVTDPDGTPRMAAVLVGGQVSWLKEMFDVTLSVKNLATDSEFEITDLNSTLKIPAGLSLASMKAPAAEQAAKQTISVLRPGEQKSIDWYLRGDVAGDYPIDIDVDAVMQPFGTPIVRTFHAAEPIHIYGENALKTIVHAPTSVTKGEEFSVKSTLVNTTPVPIYLARLRLTQVRSATLLSGNPDRVWVEIPPGEMVSETWVFKALNSGNVATVEKNGNIVVRLGNDYGLTLTPTPAERYTKPGDTCTFNLAVKADEDSSGTVSFATDLQSSGFTAEVDPPFVEVARGETVNARVTVHVGSTRGAQTIGVTGHFKGSKARAEFVAKNGMAAINGTEKVVAHFPTNPSAAAEVMRGGTALRFFTIVNPDGDIPDWKSGTADLTLTKSGGSASSKSVAVEAIAGNAPLVAVPVSAADAAAGTLPSTFNATIKDFKIDGYSLPLDQPVAFPGTVKPREFDRTWRLGRTMGAGIGVGAIGAAKAQVKASEGVSSSLKLTNSSESAGGEILTYGIDVLDKFGVAGSIGLDQDLGVVKLKGPSASAEKGVELKRGREFVYDKAFSDRSQEKEMAALALENISYAGGSVVAEKVLNIVAPGIGKSTHLKKASTGIGMYQEASAGLMELSLPVNNAASVSALSLKTSDETLLDITDHKAKFTESGKDEVSLGIVNVKDFSFAEQEFKGPFGLGKKAFRPAGDVFDYATLRMELFANKSDMLSPTRLEITFGDKDETVSTLMRVKGAQAVKKMLLNPQVGALAASMVPRMAQSSVWSDDALASFLEILMTQSKSEGIPIEFEHTRSTALAPFKIEPSIDLDFGPSVSLSGSIDYREATEYIAEQGEIVNFTNLALERYSDDQYIVPRPGAKNLDSVYDAAWDGARATVSDFFRPFAALAKAGGDWVVAALGLGSAYPLPGGSMMASAQLGSSAILSGTAGTVSTDTTITALTFTPADGSVDSTLAGGQPVCEGLALVSNLHAFAPFDLTFESPATLVITYREGDADGLAETALAIYRHDDASGTWVRLDSSVDVDANRVTASVSALGTFAIGADASIPVAIIVIPADGSSVPSDTPHIVAAIADRASQVDTDGVTLRVDNSPATVSVDASGIVTATAPSALADGQHSLRLSFSDTNGNHGSVESTFVVDTHAPSMPTGLKTTVDGGIVALNWDTHPESGVTFRAYRSGGQSPMPELIGVASGTRFVDPLAVAGAAYDYEIRAVDVAGNESRSANSGGLSIGADSGAPSAVSGLSATDAGDGILVSWSNPSDNDLMYVRVVRKSGSFSAGPTDGEVVYEGLAQTFRDTDAVRGNEYLYSAYALDFSRNWSEPTGVSIAFQELDVTPPVVIVGHGPADGANGWWRTAPVVTASTGEPSSIISHRFAPLGIWLPWTAELTMPEGVSTLYYYATDAANNPSQVASETFRVDTRVSLTSSDAQASYGEWATVRLTATDLGGSGVAATRWRLDGGAWTIGTEVSTTIPGPHLLEFYSTDLAGNVEGVRAVTFSVTAPAAVPPGVEQPAPAPVSVAVGVPQVSGKATAKKGTTLKGSLAPAHATRVSIEVQVLVKKKYKRYKTYAVASGPTGAWSYKAKMKKGTYRVRALTAADGSYLAGASGWRKVVVK